MLVKQPLRTHKTDFSKGQRNRFETKTFKMCIFKRHLQWLGHLISGEGISPLKERVETIPNLAPPRDETETRHIIGLASYYRIFVANCSDIGKVIAEHKRKDTTFNWNPHCQQSLGTIKAVLTKNPMLIFPDPNRPYFFFTDTEHTKKTLLSTGILIVNKA